MADQEYRRLTRSRVRRKGVLTLASARSSLWLGKDHLLKIDSNRYTEEYKRFYFRDIQAITIRKTKRREIWNMALMILLIVWLATLVDALLSVPVEEVAILWGTAFVFVAVPLLANNVLGPACAVYLRTAVQIEELPSLNRVRRARKVVDRIRPLIVAAQGQLTPEEISIRMGKLIQASAEAETARQRLVVPGPVLSVYPVDEPSGSPQIGVEPR